VQADYVTFYSHVGDLLFWAYACAFDATKTFGGLWHQEEQNRGKANWEHLNEELHVLITVEDTANRARIKLQRAVDEVKKLLVPLVSRSFVLAIF